MLFVCFVAWLFLLGCQYQYKWLIGNDVLMGTLNPTHSLRESLIPSVAAGGSREKIYPSTERRRRIRCDVCARHGFIKSSNHSVFGVSVTEDYILSFFFKAACIAAAWWTLSGRTTCWFDVWFCVYVYVRVYVLIISLSLSLSLSLSTAWRMPATYGCLIMRSALEWEKSCCAASGKLTVDSVCK